jgi:hypothetical protein
VDGIEMIQNGFYFLLMDFGQIMGICQLYFNSRILQSQF